MHAIVALFGIVLIFVVLIDGFEAIILPRRVTHRYRLTRFFYRSTWAVWRRASGVFARPSRREAFLSLFGPLSLLVLFALWFTGLIIGFALLQWSLDTVVQTAAGISKDSVGFLTYLYLSGTTFFTLGYGDVSPVSWAGRVLAVVESGIGFGSIAVIISYLPVLYQAFSQRERLIGLLDARAGSPPTAGEFVSRLARAKNIVAADAFLQEWERWSAELLEIHLSFPVLSYYRSQHDNQSWLAALATVLDTCSFALVGLKGVDRYQAQVTFAMARHAAVDLAMVFWTPPEAPPEDRLPAERLDRLLAELAESGCDSCGMSVATEKLAQVREMYEPFLYALSRYFRFKLPPMIAEKPGVDNWQTSAWMKRTPGIGGLPTVGDEHFY